MEIILKIFLFFSPFFLFASSTFLEIKERYGRIETLEALFKQKIYLSSLKKEREFEGEFFYKKGKGFLWRYKKPKEKVFLFDGEFLWEKEKGRQAIKEKMEKEEKRRFINIVEDIKRIEEFFELEREYKLDKERVLEVLPKDEGGIYRKVRLFIGDDLFIKKIELVEVTGNINVIEFFDVRINRGLKDELFVFGREEKEIKERPWPSKE